MEYEDLIKNYEKAKEEIKTLRDKITSLELGYGRFEVFKENIESEGIDPVFINAERVYKVSSAEDFLELINGISEEIEIHEHKDGSFSYNKNKYIWRGISANNQLKASLFRDGVNKDNELEYIRKFEENGSHLCNDYNDPVDMVAYAQHYGAKTRLLDWSTSPLVAALFALFYKCDDNNVNYHAVLFRDSYNIAKFKTLPKNNDNIHNNSNKSYIIYKDMVTRYKNLLSDVNNIGLTLVIKSKEDIIEYVTANNNYNYHNDKRVKRIIDYFDDLFLGTYDFYPKDGLINFANILDSKIVDNISKKCWPTVYQFIRYQRAFVDCNISNDRIQIQRGLFEMTTEEDTEKNILEETNVIIIDKIAREELIKSINRLGINYYLLLNDSSSCCNLINTVIKGDISYDLEINQEYIENLLKDNKNNYIENPLFENVEDEYNRCIEIMDSICLLDNNINLDTARKIARQIVDFLYDNKIVKPCDIDYKNSETNKSFAQNIGKKYATNIKKIFECNQYTINDFRNVEYRFFITTEEEFRTYINDIKRNQNI